MDAPFQLIRLPMPALPEVAAAVLHTDGLADERALASRILAAEEWVEFESLKHPGRRLEWLAARVCLKTLVRESGQVADPRDVRITRDERGRPAVSRDGGGPVGGDCSITHAGSWAAAAWTTRGDLRLGIDLELQTGRLQRIRDLFVSAADRAVVLRPDLRQLTIWWCLKEACSKAVGLGLGVGLAGVECVETAAGCHLVRSPGGEQLMAWHHETDSYVLALCITGRVDTDQVARPLSD